MRRFRPFGQPKTVRVDLPVTPVQHVRSDINGHLNGRLIVVTVIIVAVRAVLPF